MIAKVIAAVAATVLVAAAVAVAVAVQLATPSACDVGGTTIPVGATAVINGAEWLCDGGLPAYLG